MTINNNSEVNKWDVAQFEYKVALEQYRHYTILRRQDMVFVTTVQVAILTIINAKLQLLDLPSFLLSLVAFFVLVLGLNSELRLASYMYAYKERVMEIELSNNLDIVRNTSISGKGQKKFRFNLSNRVMYPFHYCIFIAAWLAVWGSNIF